MSRPDINSVVDMGVENKIYYIYTHSSQKVSEHLKNHAQLKNSSTEFNQVLHRFTFILFQHVAYICEKSQEFKNKLMFYHFLNVVGHVSEIHKMFR